MPNIENIKKYKNIHMIGIGGVSMSGIAAILSNWGFNVTGSDLSRSSSENTDKLIESWELKLLLVMILEMLQMLICCIYSCN